MSLEDLNRKYVSQYLDDAMTLVNEKQFLTVSMLEKRFNLGYTHASLLYEMIDAKLQEIRSND